MVFFGIEVTSNITFEPSKKNLILYPCVHFLTRQETSVVSVALLSLWLTVCAEGLKLL